MYNLHLAWPNLLGLFTIFIACFLGVSRIILTGQLLLSQVQCVSIHGKTGWFDPFHCRALLNDGTWLDSKHTNWQPDGCMLHSYTEKDASSCLHSKEIIFVGDSVTRKLFFQIGQILDDSLPSSLTDDGQKHQDYFLFSKYGNNLTFAWDPFLNSSYLQKTLAPANLNPNITDDPSAPPALLVLGSGLWYLRYSDSSGGILAWEKNMDHIFNSLSMHRRPADTIVILPIEQIISSKLSPDRALTMHPSDIEAMNSDLFHRIHSSETSRFNSSRTVALPLAFNKMVDESLTEDGIHYSDPLLKLQANLLLNLRCNRHLPKVFPMNKTCCNQYPRPSTLHLFILTVSFLMGPYMLYRAFHSGSLQDSLFGKSPTPQIVISLSIAIIYLADRTDLWQKEHKQFNAWAFGMLLILSLVVGLVTVERRDTDSGFMNRDQTDEWKGWMQIMILIYHYFRASQISGIYNLVRVLVSSYLFMTGYGHTIYYLRKADFGFLRMAQILIRLNLFTILLAYTMNTDYLFYYFTPLVSMWYIIIFITLVIGARYNDRTPFLLCKILLSAASFTWFMNKSWLLGAMFDILHRFFGIHWSSREWAFRVNLDIWIVYVGMLTAILMIKIRENRLVDHPRWPVVVKFSTGISIIVILWYSAFELMQESKFTYNAWHPYVSFLPVLAFAILRNSSVILRSASSRAFAFVGKCSLETFIIQFHFLLAGDSKGLLLVIPGTRWRPINMVVISIMFFYLCSRIADATASITGRLTGTVIKDTPLPTTRVEGPLPALREAQAIPLQSLKDKALKTNSTNVRRRWVDRLAEASPKNARSSNGNWGLSARIVLFLGFLWLMNILWTYSNDLDNSGTEIGFI